MNATVEGSPSEAHKSFADLTEVKLGHRQNILNTTAEVSPEDHLWTPGGSFGAQDRDLPSL